MFLTPTPGWACAAPLRRSKDDDPFPLYYFHGYSHPHDDHNRTSSLPCRPYHGHLGRDRDRGRGRRHRSTILLLRVALVVGDGDGDGDGGEQSSSAAAAASARQRALEPAAPDSVRLRVTVRVFHSKSHT